MIKISRISIRILTWFVWSSVFFGIFFCQVTVAQSNNDYPKKPIRIIVSFAPGGGTDIIARILSVKLTEILKQPVYIENKVGASANIGTQYVANATPDGIPVTQNITSCASGFA